MTASVRQRPPAVEADVAIVGGGVIGTATAFALRDLAPDLRVVIVEAERLAHGASGRNAGFLLLGTHADYASAVATYGRDRARRLWRFTSEAYRLAADFGGRREVGFAATGSVFAAGDDAEVERLRASHALLEQDGVASEVVERGEVEARTGGQGFPAALIVPDGGVIDPARLVATLAAESGARVIERWPVAQIESEGGRTRLAGPDGGEVIASRVLVAANASLPRLIPALASVVRPVRAQMFATAPAPLRLAAPVYSHGGYYYLRQRADGRVLVGGARHLHEADEVGYADATTDALQASLAAYVAEHFPDFAGLAVERRWSGTMGFSPDGLPALGNVPGVPGAHFAAGFTGHGMGYALRFGRLAARVMVGESDPAADLFDARRFGPDGQPGPLAADVRAA
ncbi:NAD(P)/FAD-dependent oxidoreductase [Rubrivirga sp. IMCC45206]|uniref:NAD(P)/FAD-dependent oxidoreductase n=1 Tax=Rubrivirga sp. IMCC45206 TaxID=3391614 RepID=UPI0039900120